MKRLIGKISAMSLTQTGFALIILFSLITGGVFLYSLQSTSEVKGAKSSAPAKRPTPTIAAPTDTPEPTDTPGVAKSYKTYITTEPKIDCVGPDGKHLAMTQQQCDSFNSAWATPLPTVTPTPAITDTPTPSEAPSDTPVLSTTQIPYSTTTPALTP